MRAPSAWEDAQRRAAAPDARRRLLARHVSSPARQRAPGVDIVGMRPSSRGASATRRGRHRLERLTSEIEYQAGDWRREWIGCSSTRRGVSTQGRARPARGPLARAGGRRGGSRREVVQNGRARVGLRRGSRLPEVYDRASAGRRRGALAHVGRSMRRATRSRSGRAMQPRPQPRDEAFGPAWRRSWRRRSRPSSSEAASLGRGARIRARRAVDSRRPRVRARRVGQARAKAVFTEAAELAPARGARTARRSSLRSGCARSRCGPGGGVLREAWADRAGTRDRAAHRRRREQSRDRAAPLRLAKTVERHVSNVLRKVGARNRAELAARVALELEGVHR